jgi:gas vesicle protein
MSKARRVILGGVIGAAVGVVLAPRGGESRREALDRLRLAARPGRGAIRAFAGTPCSAEDTATVHGQGGAPRAAGAAPAATGGGDDGG